MSYLQENNSQNLAARITNYGRRKIAQGDFNISYFQIGDSEYDYGFSVFDGVINSAQKVLMPLDKDSQVKYPYKVSSSSLTGTTYGVPQQFSYSETIRNDIEAAGYVSEYIPYNVSVCSGTTVQCGFEEIDISALSGTTTLYLPTGNTFANTTYITIYFDTLCLNGTITNAASSLVYRIVSLTTGATFNTVILDRVTPDYTSLAGKTITVISNDCGSPGVAWTLNNIWSRNPAGLSETDNDIDELLSGYTSNIYVSSKEFFGYNTSSGQIINTGTTITNSFGDVILVTPEEQHSLSILHFSKSSDILLDPDLAFKYEDYIDHSIVGEDYFEIYIPFIYYERTGSTVGARFFMDSTDYYINSSATDTKLDQIKYRYLIDEIGNKVGKIFVNHKVIVFDDQEIVAALDYKSNRRYTLPIPRISAIPVDSKCDVNGEITTPLLSGTTGQTVYVTYLLQYTGDTSLSGMCCNYYCKLTGGTIDSDVSIKFGPNDFRYLQSAITLSGSTVGYIANKFQILAQRVYPTYANPNPQPDPTGWRVIDFTSQIPNHTVGDLIDKTNLQNARFIITYSDYIDADLYIMSDPDLIDTSISPEFGDEQPFTGSVKVTRATDLEVMRYLINLPAGYFETTQNPSYIVGEDKRITEVVLLDENKNVLVIAKTSSPIVRTGTQVLAVKIDI